MPTRHTARVTLTALLTASILGSCQPVVHDQTLSFDPPLTRVVVSSDIGDVTVLGTPTQRVIVEQRVEGWRGALAVEHEVRGEVLYVDVRCEGVLQCHASTLIEVPSDLDVDVDVGEGSVTLDGLGGALDLALGSGPVSGTGLSPLGLAVAVADGAVDLEFEVAPTDLTVAVGRGDVRVLMAEEPGRVIIDAADGEVQQELTEGGGDSRVEISVARGDVALLAH